MRTGQAPLLFVQLLRGVSALRSFVCATAARVSALRSRPRLPKPLVESAMAGHVWNIEQWTRSEYTAVLRCCCFEQETGTTLGREDVDVVVDPNPVGPHKFTMTMSVGVVLPLALVTSRSLSVTSLS